MEIRVRASDPAHRAILDLARVTHTLNKIRDTQCSQRAGNVGAGEAYERHPPNGFRDNQARPLPTTRSCVSAV